MTGAQWAASVDRALVRAAHPVAFPLVGALLGRRAARRVPGLGVLVADPGLVRQVLTDTSFRKDGPGSSGALWAGVLGHRTLIGMDGPPHRRLRRALAPVFTPALAEDACAAALTGPLGQVTTRLRDGEPVDLVTVARDTATAVIAQLIGMDPHPGLAHAADQVLAMIGLGTRRLSAHQNRQVHALLRPLTTPATAAYDQASPGGARQGTGCVMAQLPAAGISREQAPSLAAVLLLTGTETVVSAAPRALAILLDSGHLPRLLTLTGQARRQALGDIVTEAVRLATPSPAMLRRATRDRDLGPVRIRAGDRVLLLTWWATRLPGGFRPGRDPGPTRQLAFGAGAHQCPGRSLAEQEITAILTAVLDAVPPGGGLRITGRRARRHVLVPSYRALTVTVR